MLERINKFIFSSLIASVLFIILGLGLVIFPKVSINVIAIIMAILFILMGIYLCIVNHSFIFVMDTILSGILMVTLGVILLMNPSSFALFIPIMLGIWIIVDSIFKLRISLLLKKYEDTPWVMSFILSLLSLICGILFILNPVYSSTLIVSTVGIIIIIYSIINIVDMIMFKNNCNKIVKAINKHIKVIDME